MYPPKYIQPVAGISSLDLDILIAIYACPYMCVYACTCVYVCVLECMVNAFTYTEHNLLS